MFSARDKSTACGMWSTTYIIALAIVICVIVVGLILSRKMSHKAVRRTIICFAIFGVVTEICKMIFVGVTYGVDEVEFVPLYFCSLFIYCTIMSLFKNETIKNTGLSFLFFGGIAGAISFFAYPSACIPNYPIYHFMCLRTMIFHGSMIYIGILIVMTKYYTPTLKHFLNFAVLISIVSILAIIMNSIQGTNLMYISKPLKIDIVKDIYAFSPHLYALLVVLLQIVVPYWTTAAIYYIIINVVKNFRTKKEVIREV